MANARKKNELKMQKIQKFIVSEIFGKHGKTENLVIWTGFSFEIQHERIM